MLVYVSDYEEFSTRVLSNEIAGVLVESVRERLNIGVSPSEIKSWHNSMPFMRNALEVANVPNDAGIAIEFQIPRTAKRVDVLVSGIDQFDEKQVVILELKQWQNAQKTTMPSVVETALGGGLVRVAHPSYQAYSYKSFIQDFNEAVQTETIGLQACSFLHNCEDSTSLRDSVYDDDLSQAPLFLANEVNELAEFISRYVRRGDQAKSLYDIESGRLRPSKQLIEHLTSLLEGNDEFILLDEQKVIAETIVALEGQAQAGKRQVYIVEGGPGTGKSVLAINLLARLTADERVAQYVTRNTAPRNVFESKLTGTFKKSRITNLFKSSGSYINAPARSIDATLVDEAHRLSPKSGPMGNLGENQVKEIIEASNLSVFFLDEDQQVLFKDIGTRKEIERWASQLNAEITHGQLESQFRCNGSDGYLAWLDHVLQVRPTANTSLAGLNYDFRVFDSPNELFDAILQQDSASQNARVVAGYCWEWLSKKNPDAYDIVFEEHDFKKRWNLTSHGNYWIVEPDSISEIGCIHTCQGLELDYVGVIIGADLVIRNGEVVTDSAARAKGDQTIRGHRAAMKVDPETTLAKLDRVIKNTYRTLMTRGLRGCYIYSVDKETNEYFKRQQGSDANFHF